MPEVDVGTVALKRVDYRAVVRGLFAEVTVEQRFENSGEQPVEAVYVFPLPDAAAVRSCTMQIGDRTITAELKRRKQAEKEYEEAVESGHHAALATQERPNVFTMNVGGIEKGETAVVTLTYVQEMPWQAGGGRFRIPLVLAPRFIPPGVADADRISPPVSVSGVPYKASVTVDIAPGFPAAVSSPSHLECLEPALVSRGVGITVETGEVAPDRDFVLIYTNTSEQPEIAVHQGTHGDEHFALIHVLPTVPAVKHDADILFLLDISGSMRGGKIEGLRTIVRRMLRDIVESGARHRVGVVLFDDQQELLAALGTPIDQILPAVDTIQARGNTYLGRALNFAFAQFDDAARPKYIVLVNDGQTEELEFTAVPGIRVIAAGIDAAVNDTSLRTVAEATNGVTEYFYPGEDFDHVARRLLGHCAPPVFHDLMITGNEVSEKEVVGQQYVTEGRPTTLAIRFKKSVPSRVIVTGARADGSRTEWQVALPAEELAMPERRCDFAHALWAREKLRTKDNPDAIADLSLRYGILSAETAFVAVLEKAVPGAKPVRQEVPVSLPHGWEFGRDSAAGGPAMAMMCFASLGGGGPAAGAAAIDSLDCDAGDAFLGDVEVEPGAIHGGGSIGMFDPDDDDDLVSYPPLPEPFTLDASHPADLIIGLVLAFDEGFNDAETAQALQLLEEQLIQVNVSAWSEAILARTYYFLTRLEQRLEEPVVEEDVMEKFFVGKPTDPLAAAWMELERFWQGNSDGSGIAFPPEDHMNDEWWYIRFLVGQGSRPTHDPWARLQ